MTTTLEAKSLPAGLDTRVPNVVKVLNGALDEDETSSSGLVLNGRLDTQTLRCRRSGKWKTPLRNARPAYELRSANRPTAAPNCAKA